MNSIEYREFPMLGKWRGIKVISKGKEISEPAQEVEFCNDGTCIHLIDSPDHTRIVRLKGIYFFTPPDQAWVEMRPGEMGAAQTIIVNGEQAELRANDRISYLRRIGRTEFVEPVINCR